MLYTILETTNNDEQGCTHGKESVVFSMREKDASRLSGDIDAQPKR